MAASGATTKPDPDPQRPAHLAIENVDPRNGLDFHDEEGYQQVQPVGEPSTPNQLTQVQPMRQRGTWR